MMKIYVYELKKLIKSFLMALAFLLYLWKGISSFSLNFIKSVFIHILATLRVYPALQLKQFLG